MRDKKGRLVELVVPIYYNAPITLKKVTVVVCYTEVSYAIFGLPANQIGSVWSHYC